MWVPAVLTEVRGVDLVVDARIGLSHEGDVFFHAAGLDAAFMPRLYATKPGAGAPVHAPDIKVVAQQYFPIGKEGGISLGLMYAAIGVGAGGSPIVARYFTGDRDGPLRIAIALSYVASALGLVLVATLVSFPVVLIGTLLHGVGAGVIWVFSTQLLLQLVPNEVQGRVFSTEFMMVTLMNAIAAGAAGRCWTAVRRYRV